MLPAAFFLLSFVFLAGVLHKTCLLYTSPVKTNQNWLPSIFNDFFDNEWMARANATAPAINVIENEKDYVFKVRILVAQLF